MSLAALLPAYSDMGRAAERLGASLPTALDTAARREAFRACGGFGMFGAARSLDGLALAEVWEALGHGCEDNGLTFALAAHAFAVVEPLLAHASDAVRARLVPGLLDGTRIGAHAATEAGAGSDVMGMQARAERDGEGFRLSGTKELVTNGADADVLVVFAKADEGVTGFVLERDTPGLTVGAPRPTMGLAGASLTSVYLDGCPVGPEAVLAGLGRGGDVFATAMLWERTMILAPQVGAMRRQLERGVAHARSRRQFGRPIGKNQLVAARVVALYERYVLARGLLRESAADLARGALPPARACLTKLKLSEWALETHLDAVRLHGGTGYLTEAGLEAQLRDAVGGVLYSGTSDMQRVILAAYLGL